MMRQMSIAPSSAGSTQEGLSSDEPVRHRDLQRDGHRGAQGDLPACLALGAAAPRGRLRRMAAFDAGVQQRGRGHARRLQPLRDDVLQLVQPLVQRLDAVQHMRVVRWRGLADTPSSGVRIVVADRSHSTSLPGPSSRRAILVRDSRNNVPHAAERLPERDPCLPAPASGAVSRRLEPVGQPVQRVKPLHARPPGRLRLPGPAAVPHPRQGSERRLRSRHQVGERAAGQVGLRRPRAPSSRPPSRGRTARRS